MNKKNYLILLTLLSSIVLGQATQEDIDLFNSLPQDIRDQILEERGLADRPSVEIENSLEGNESTEALKDEIDTEGTKIFGLDFFDFKATTTAPLLDIPLPADYSLSVNDELEILLIGNENKI